MLDRGEVPPLKALRLHNGTSTAGTAVLRHHDDGKPHLRIECRVLPAGPTVRDEVANAASSTDDDGARRRSTATSRKRMTFDDASRTSSPRRATAARAHEVGRRARPWASTS
jgi:hypothetical protein